MTEPSQSQSRSDEERLHWLLRRLDEQDLFRIVGRAADADGVFTFERIIEVIDEDMNGPIPASLSIPEPRPPLKMAVSREWLRRKIEENPEPDCGVLAAGGIVAPVSEQQRIPEGWRTVPLFPTPAMIEVGQDMRGKDYKIREIYMAMLAAVEQPDERSGE